MFPAEGGLGRGPGSERCTIPLIVTIKPDPPPRPLHGSVLSVLSSGRPRPSFWAHSSEVTAAGPSCLERVGAGPLDHPSGHRRGGRRGRGWRGAAGGLGGAQSQRGGHQVWRGEQRQPVSPVPSGHPVCAVSSVPQMGATLSTSGVPRVQTTTGHSQVGYQLVPCPVAGGWNNRYQLG